MMKDMFCVTIGQELANARKDKGYSQQDVADRLRVSRSNIANWEVGRRQMDIVTFLKLCEILNVDGNDILDKAKKYLYK